MFVKYDNSIIYNRGGPIVQYTNNEINIILPDADDIDNSNNIYYTEQSTNNIGLKDMYIYLNNDISTSDNLTLTSFPSDTICSYDKLISIINSSDVAIINNSDVAITNSSDVAIIAGTDENFNITSTSEFDISISNIIVNTDSDISYSLLADYYN